MGDYRLVIEGIGSHHGCSDSCADTVARAAIAELQRIGHNVKGAKLVALDGEAGGFDADERTDPPAVDLLAPVPRKGDTVAYHYTNMYGTRCTREAIVAVVWNPKCINVNVVFQEGDSEMHHGAFPEMGTSRTSVLGDLDAKPGEAEAPATWSRR
jgi:hypothetical protein